VQEEAEVGILQEVGVLIGNLHGEAGQDRDGILMRSVVWMEEGQVWHFSGIQRLAVRAISASAELRVLYLLIWLRNPGRQTRVHGGSRRASVAFRRNGDVSSAV